MRIVRNILRIITSIILIVMILFLLLFLKSRFIDKERIPNVFGFSILRVASGSMEPILNVDDFVIISPSKNYKTNDIVTYIDSDDMIVTHRIVKIDGNSIIAKGDANNTSDKEFDKKNIKGKVLFHFPGKLSDLNMITVAAFLFIVFLGGFFVTILIPEEKR